MADIDVSVVSGLLIAFIKAGVPSRGESFALGPLILPEGYAAEYDSLPISG